MDKLTTKQRLFLKEYVRTNGNGTQAALRVYDTKNPKTASAIGAENLAKPSVKQELDRILRDKLPINKLTDKLDRIVSEEPAKGYSGSEIMDAIKTSLKLHGVLTERKQVTSYNIHADLSNMSEHELIQLRNKKKQETDKIIEEDL